MRARLIAAPLVLLALAACERPTPGVTMASGTTSVHTEAAVFCHEGQSAAAQDCAEDLDALGVVRVRPGQPLSIDVPGEVADHGWVVVDPDTKQRSDVQDETHLSLTFDFARRPVINLEVHALDEVSDSATVTGVWRFQLVQK